MEWENIHAELVNKIRWALASTVAANSVCNLSYGNSMTWARIYASDIVEGLKAKVDQPEFQPWLTASGSKL